MIYNIDAQSSLPADDYSKIMAADSVLDLTVGWKSWLAKDDDIVRVFEIVDLKFCNVVVVDYGKGERDYLSLKDFKRYVEAA